MTMHDAAPGTDSEGGDGEDLARLLSCLDPDPARACEKYEQLRLRLSKFFECNHCMGPEALADKVLDRIAVRTRTETIRNVSSYSRRVARFVCMEQMKRRPVMYIEDTASGGDALPDGHDPPAEIIDMLYQERRLECLRRCMARLSPDGRRLLLLYYSAEDRMKIPFRKNLATDFGMSVTTLRVRMTRFRAKLERCVINCLETHGNGPIRIR